jgi:hypothetical protein
MVSTRRSLREKNLRNTFTNLTETIESAPVFPRQSMRLKKIRKEKEKLSKKIKKKEKEISNPKGKKNRTIIEKNIKKTKKKFVSGDSLDLVLICDCTGSMGSWMKRAKETLHDIIQNVLKAHEGLTIRISFVGYRDFCDNARQFAILNFTEDVQQVKDFIDKEPATGGGDMPEDVVGAYIKVSELEWKAETRIAFHICDAPAHGRQYHNDKSIWDTYPNGHPSKTTVEQMMTKMKQLNVNLTFIKLTMHTDTMFEKMCNAYNDNKFSLELTDMDQSNLQGKTKEDIDKAFIDKASFIISTKVTNKGKKVEKKDPLWTGEMEVGQWFSSTNYIKIEKVEAGKVEVVSSVGGKWSMSKDLVQKMDSADHFDYEIPMNRAELVEMLENTKDTIFTICFRKKVQPKNISSKIVEEGEDFVGNLSQCKKLAKNFLEGELCVIVAKLVNLEPKLGRSMVKDLRVPFGYNLRQVDHRTIEWIIFKNRKFIFKKPGKKYPELPESAYKIDDPIHTRWNIDKLSIGNWLSDTKYIKIEKIIDSNLVEVKNSNGHPLVMSRDILKNEMYSACHYNEEEKLPLTAVASVLEDVGKKVFTAVFNSKVNERVVAEKLNNMESGISGNPRKLNKFVKEMITGNQVTVCGHLASRELKLGRSLVINLTTDSAPSFKQIDHRGLESIIFKNKKYIVK